MSKLFTSPYTEMLETPRTGILRQELVTYEEHNGVVRKITTVRNFFDKDYNDSQTIVVISS